MRIAQLSTVDSALLDTRRTVEQQSGTGDIQTATDDRWRHIPSTQQVCIEPAHVTIVVMLRKAYMTQSS